uniref:Uncharacterized protein n=1 Tax=Promethearchaeum syntrophicum TaxID=2594042 RepID=A0A5B9D6A5_9ARCH|nr:hypothetical protein DSAG12_00140 [Candidatus Prometheoarchaeum syntrophicum]
MNKLYFGENFLDDLYEFFVDISINLKDYAVKLLWILLIYIILRVFWFFLFKLKITITYKKKTEFKS